MKKMMQKTLAAVALVGFMAPAAHAAATASATATWKATAKKDTASDLVITPLGSLNFEYAEGIKGFSSADGLFDVSVKGNAGPESAKHTAFTLKAKKASGTLTSLGSKSTLDVGVSWMGKAVDEKGFTVLIDTKNSVNGGKLAPIGAGSLENNKRSSAQAGFSFNIQGGTSATGTALTDLSTLPDGMWSGDVVIEFEANWAA